MYIDSWEADVSQLPQGKGQDHTLWDWAVIDAQGKDKVHFYQDKAEVTEEEVRVVQDQIDEFWQGMTSEEVTAQLRCELHRNEEINLYYQCTQNGYNNYALDHFGGDMRSYPRWVWEFARCNVMLGQAECCSVPVDGVDFACPKCTDITVPALPTPFSYALDHMDKFGEGQVTVDVVHPEPVCKLPNLSFLSVFRVTSDNSDVVGLTKATMEQQLFCMEMKTEDGVTGTLTFMKPDAPYHPSELSGLDIRMDQEDCSIHQKPKGASEWGTGRVNQYGAPFLGWDAYSFDHSPDMPAGMYDAKVGYCQCIEEEAKCHTAFLPKV